MAVWRFDLQYLLLCTSPFKSLEPSVILMFFIFPLDSRYFNTDVLFTFEKVVAPKEEFNY